MNFNAAFEITEDDILTVLRSNMNKIENANGISFAAMAEVIFNEMDVEEFDRITRAALDSGTEMDEQTEGAHREIEVILKARGILRE